MESDHDYFTRRAAAELLAVDAADSDQSRTAHAELAKRYDELARRSDNIVRIKAVPRRSDCDQATNIESAPSEAQGGA